MADFVAVLRKTLDSFGDATPEAREKVYGKARSTVNAKLAAINPPPPVAVADRQRQALEDAIATLEKEYRDREKVGRNTDDPLAELENVFASLRNPTASASTVSAGAPATAGWPRTTPVVSAAPASAPESRLAPEDEPVAPASERDYLAEEEETEHRRNYFGLIAAAVLVALIAGSGYGLWLNREAFTTMLSGEFSAPPPADVPSPAAPATDVASAPPAGTTPAATPAEPADASATAKFTQRLNPDGTEIDAGPGGQEATIGEGTSLAEATVPPAGAPETPPAAEAPAAPAEDTAAADTAPPAQATPPVADVAPPQAALPDATPPQATTPEATPPSAGADATAENAAPDAAEPAPAVIPPVAGTVPAAPPSGSAPDPVVAVGQKAIFYEERTNVAEGSAEPGSTVWSLVQESPGGDLPPEPAIRAEATIPAKDLQIRMTIRRNADRTLPASHIIEVIFLTPDGFEGGGIDNILRIAMKSSEQEAGNPLIGIPAKIADGFFLVALNDTKAEEDANLTLLRRQNWIDLPVVYKSGRRALFTMEKGIPGDRVFDEALRAWQAKAAG